MPRPDRDKAKLEAARLELLHDEQAKLRKQIVRSVKKGGSHHLPGEDRHKKELAVFMKLANPGISYTKIAENLGENKTIVKRWFREDPAVKEFYEWALSHLKASGLQLLQTHVFEAAETLALLMRYGSERYMFEAARDILDRVGVPKVIKQEIESENKRSHSWEDRDKLAEEIRALSPEQQEEAIEALEKFEKLLSEPSSSKELVEEEFEDDVDG